jgi:hypothetical protein
MLAEGLHLASDMQIWPSIATQYTDLHVHNPTRTKKQAGARVFSPYDPEAMRRRLPFRASQEIDPMLLQRVVEWRAERLGFAVREGGEPELEHGYDNPLIIPPDRRLNEIEVENTPMPERDVPPNITTGLWSMSLFMDVLQGVDAAGESQSLKVSMILLQANTPGTDPLVAVKQMGEQNNRLSAAVLLTLGHMKQVLANDFSQGLSMSDAFSTGTGREAARLCCEALLPHAVFRHAAAHGVRDVHFGGMRMDVENREEMELWREYEEGVARARLQHYSLVLEGVTHALKPGGWRKYNEPPETCFPLDVYDGVNYRYVTQEHMAELVEACVAQQPADERPQFALDMQQWKDGLLQSATRVFIPDSHAWARNTGVLVFLNIDAFSPWLKPRAKLPDEPVFSVIPQLVKAIPLLDLYISNRVEPLDPMHVVWSGEQAIVPDLAYLADEEHRLPECLQTLRAEMRELATTSVSNRSPRDMRHEELTLLYGAERNRVHAVLRGVQLRMHLSAQAHVSYNAVLSATKAALASMVTGELMHWAFAARSVLDLKAQASGNGERWMADWRGFAQHLRAGGLLNCASALDETTNFAHFMAYQDKRLGMELAFQNNATLDLLTYGQMATFCWQPKYWGMCVKVADVGHSVDVVERGRGRPTVVTVNTKKMGSGVDSVAEVLGNMNNAYGRVLVLAPEVRKFYNSRQSLDHNNSRISELSMAALYGSALPTGPDGKIDFSTANHVQTTGTMLIRTEHMKQQSFSEEARAWMANFETTQNDSGTGTGTEKEGWQTTRGLKGVTYVRMFGAPVILIAGNRQDDAFPPSTLGGGRIQSVCSSVMDQTGELEVLLSSQEAVAARDARPSEFSAAFSDGRAAKRRRTDALWSLLESDEARDTVQVRVLTDDFVEDNMRYFCMRHLWRKALPFVHRTMTLGVVHGGYELYSSFASMTLSVRGLTDGLRRSYLVDATSYKRNAQGPWQTVSAFATFGMQISDWCLVRALRTASTRIDLPRAFHDMVLAFLHVPLTFSAKLSSLHSWLFTNVLDISSMVLFSYMMYITGLRGHCPLTVLALAAKDLPLSPLQQMQYDAFCEATVHVAVHAGLAANPTSALRGVCNVPQGVLAEPSRDALLRWFTWKISDEGLMQTRDTRLRNKEPSAYVRPRMQFVSREAADWAVNNSGKKEDLDEFTAKTASRIVAHAYALEQTEKAHGVRVQHGTVLAPFEFPHKFWEAAHKGTRLPKMDGDSAGMDRYELLFQPVWQTGYWYEQTIRRLGACRGVMKHFLVLCGMDEDTTLNDLAAAIYAPYLRAHVRDCTAVRFHDNPEWTAPILARPEVFAWGCVPHARSRCIEGVEVILGMSFAHYIVAQALVCRGWRASGDRYSVLVHLRNMAFMSLELLTLFLHTRIEKAVVPANDGHLVLPQRSPHGVGLSAQVPYDERLHVDSVDSVDDMLCLRARQASEWRFEPSGPSLQYATRTDPGDFPFPPESVAHMPTHYAMMLRAAASLPGSLALAMRLYGCSVRSEMVSHVPLTLTHCVVRAGREVPCVSFAGHLAVLSCAGDRVTLESVAPTEACEAPGLPGPAFAALPLASPAVFSPFLLGDVMCCGLRRNDDAVTLNPRGDGEPLPLYFFPVVHWPHLVLVSVARHVAEAREMLGAEERCRVHLVRVRDFCAALAPVDCAAWRAANPDVHPDAGGADLTLFARGAQLVFCVASARGPLLLNSKAELKLLHHDSGWLAAEWVHPEWVADVGGEPHVLRQTAAGVVAEPSDYCDDEYAACLRSLQLERQGIATLEQTAQRLAAEARPTAALESAREEREHNRTLLEQRLAACVPRRSVRSRLCFGPVLETWREAVAPGTDAVFGLVQPHAKARFLDAGLYNVTHLDDDAQRATSMDFVTMSRCIVREGSRLHFVLDATSTAQLLAAGYAVAVELQQTLLADETLAMLDVFYVLGGTALHAHVADAWVHVMVRIAGDGLHRLAVRVYDRHGNRRLFSHPGDVTPVEMLAPLPIADSRFAFAPDELVVREAACADPPLSPARP